MAVYKYTGFVLVGGITGKRFPVHKFGAGNFHRNRLVSTETGIGGVHLSPNYLQSVFEIVSREKVLTILKKVNTQEDSYIKKQIGRDDNLCGFALAFEGIFGDGEARYVQTVEFWSAKIIAKSRTRENGLSLSVFTFKTEEATLAPMSSPP